MTSCEHSSQTDVAQMIKYLPGSLSGFSHHRRMTRFPDNHFRTILQFPAEEFRVIDVKHLVLGTPDQQRWYRE